MPYILAMADEDPARLLARLVTRVSEDDEHDYLNVLWDRYGRRGCVAAKGLYIMELHRATGQRGGGGKYYGRHVWKSAGAATQQLWGQRAQVLRKKREFGRATASAT